MGEILIPGGAGGISSDDVTVTKADVPKGLYAVTKDSNDEVVAGTMALTGNATTAQVYPGKTFYTTDYKTKLTGTMPTQGGATYTPGTADKTLVSANRYVTGNIVMKGDANLKAANIKKGVKILGVTGTYEGFYAGGGLLYNRGTWANGYSASNIKVVPTSDTWVTDCTITAQSSAIKMTAGSGGGSYQSFVINNLINFQPYSKLKLILSSNYSTGFTFEIAIKIPDYGSDMLGSDNRLLYQSITQKIGSTETSYEVDVTSVSASGYLYFNNIVYKNNSLYIYKIELV